MAKSGFGKFLTGALLGAGIGVLFAPKTGKELRKDIKKKCDEIMEELKNVKLADVRKKISQKIDEIQNELKDLDKEKVLKVAKQKASKLEKKCEDLYKLAVEKGTPVLEKSVEELKKSTADALKKIIKKLETSEKA